MTATAVTAPVTSPSAVPGSAVYPVPAGGGPGTETQGIKIVRSRIRGTVEQGLRHAQLLAFQCWEIDGNDADKHRLLDEKILDIDDSTLAASETLLPSWIEQDWLTYRWIPYDAGDPAETGWFEIRLRDILVLRLSPYNSHHANSTGLNTICDVTTSGSTWCGLVVDGNSFTNNSGTTSGLESHAFGGQIVRSIVNTQPVLNVGSSDVVAATKDRVDVGTLNIDQLLTMCTTVGATPSLSGPEVLMCAFQFQVSGTPTDWPIPSPNAARTYVFILDGNDAVVVNPYEKTVGTWLNVTGVTSPDSLSTCRLISPEPWGGRIAIAHPDVAPNSVYFCKRGDPTDWSFGTNPGDAFKLDASSSYGVPADAVTALLPLSDDIFLIGCATRKYFLRGDPTSGGIFKDVPGEGGIIGPRALCKAGEGRIVYLSQSGLKMMRFGGEIIEDKAIGDHRVDDILSRVSTFTTLVQLVYEALSDRVHIYLEPKNAEDVGVHLYLNMADNSIWPVEYPGKFGPTAVCKIAGQDPDDNRDLLGGRDGFIRRPIFAAASDDGEVVDAWIKFPPVTLNDGHQLVNVLEIQAVGEPGSGPVEWKVYVANSADELAQLTVDDTPAASGTWFGDNTGFQQPVDPGVAGGAAQLVVRQQSASSSFALSKVTIVVEPWGERRI